MSVGCGVFKLRVCFVVLLRKFVTYFFFASLVNNTKEEMVQYVR